MRIFIAFRHLSLIFFLAIQFSGFVNAQDLTLFGSPGCPYCKEIENFFNSNGVEYKYYDVEDEAGYEKLLDIEMELGIRQSGDFPAVYFEEKSRMFYYGIGEIKDSLVFYLGLEENSQKELKDSNAENHTEAAAEVESQDEKEKDEDIIQTASKDDNIYLIYFYEAGCPECARVSRHLNFIVSQNENIVIERHYINERESILLNEALSNEYDVADHNRLQAPSIFTSAGFLEEKKCVPFYIDSLVAISEPGVFWELTDEDLLIAESKILERFQGITVLTVIVAGLLDGINPCAFAVLIFLITYLMVLKKERKTVLLAGLSFTAGVFTLYFSAGLGFTTLINYLHRFNNVSTILNLFFAATLLVFAFLNLNDYFAIKKNRYDKVKLSMSNNMSKKMHGIIKRIDSPRFLFLNSFIAGFIMSLFELTCTGQVYLPTIIYMREVAPERSLFLLFLFNLMFIVPTLLVFLLIYKGVTASMLQKFMHKNSTRVKLGFFFLFIFMATILILSAIFYY